MIDLFKLNYFTADCAEACEKQLSKKNHDNNTIGLERPADYQLFWFSNYCFVVHSSKEAA